MINRLKKDWAYRGFKIGKITRQEYRHIFLLLFWPFYIVTFFAIGKLAMSDFHVIHCGLDDIIPFCEYFVIPYAFWYPFWICMLAYTFFFEVPVFKKAMKYFMITFSISLVIYAVWHTGHNMWPTTFPRENVCTWLVRRIYAADYNTNICPSDHVIGAFAVVFIAKETKRFSKMSRWIVILAIAILITISICFVKQHSSLYILGAVPVILIGYIFAFKSKNKYENSK